MGQKLAKLESSFSKPISLHYGVVLTGGIACGKSSVGEILRARGFEIICADSIAHRVLEESASTLIDIFGESIADFDSKSLGVINRKALGEIVFSDPAKRALLESITHPHIHAQIIAKACGLEARKRWYFLDIPLFFESGGRVRYGVDVVVCVSAKEKLQLARLMQRSALSLSQAKARVRAQMPLEQKIAQSDIVIDNNSTLAALNSKVDFMLHTLTTRA
ncbi:dephospho-CoA kinase [Helicobacter sp.]|uniref:dephospho-CoA kinase n=1 Tax=Helicobacter sp. TaxID=218 RepID=UPI0025BC35B2|nr:dephospho-CoA kinase [Helicobacter sp.]MBR2493963.1 dephospho-CoA kinase [Helicobacter sp.]